MSYNIILEVEDLSLETKQHQKLVNRVSFALGKWETLGLVGESGSGKSLTLRAILGLLPRGVEKVAGTVQSDERTAMVFQDPRGALDPLCPVVKQLSEVVRFRQQVSKKAARGIALELLERLGLPDSLKTEDRYPSQLSGGQCQRVVIAIALACKPSILLCDEPTTALDVTVQKQIIETISALQKDLGFAMVFVTHNLAVAAAMCSKLCVMKNGEIVEQGETLELLQNPQDPYTQMLINSVLPVPELEGSERIWN
ncbi:ABC-type dipeptide/oligopeptide/nickel transport system ATPase component [Fontibacillus phaseoli]|uniref:ABC-type dipeptide/oligopeptide/nickel transport system ATPase component n=1 Tax=Fontibacillus phaseoli TaxID=1416533 RepID=A0A369BJ67_9BACL|nr:ABC transporter ATP-binding protein [Fontibacillus phaseoli]RCX21640.1 ABC-type dipeptide/oligopeptide/nickel transport system ATPase component [Fontibacillus phaseoli]